MRMCSSEYEVYPDFYKIYFGYYALFGNNEIRYRIAEKKKKEEKTVENKEETEKKVPEKEKTAEEQAAAESPGRQNLILQSLDILEKLFPEAGFTSLAENPDMYPYFQPLYSFPEGFNLLSPQNPLHVTIILLRIIEDFFRGAGIFRWYAPMTEKIPLNMIIYKKSLRIGHSIGKSFSIRLWFPD